MLKIGQKQRIYQFLETNASIKTLTRLSSAYQIMLLFHFPDSKVIRRIFKKLAKGSADGHYSTQCSISFPICILSGVLFQFSVSLLYIWCIDDIMKINYLLSHNEGNYPLNLFLGQWVALAFTYSHTKNRAS